MLKIKEEYTFNSKAALKSCTTTLSTNPFFWENYRNMSVAELVTQRRNSIIVEFNYDELDDQLPAVRAMIKSHGGFWE